MNYNKYVTSKAPKVQTKTHLGVLWTDLRAELTLDAWAKSALYSGLLDH